jgi:hypothetical protein
MRTQNVLVQDNDGRIALHLAEDEQIVNLLLDSTADASEGSLPWIFTQAKIEKRSCRY